MLLLAAARGGSFGFDRLVDKLAASPGRFTGGGRRVARIE